MKTNTKAAKQKVIYLLQTLYLQTKLVRACLLR